MSIESLKLEIIEVLLKTNDEQLLNYIKKILEEDGLADFWDELSEEDKLAVSEGLHQLDNGEGVPHKLVKEDIKKRFGF